MYYVVFLCSMVNLNIGVLCGTFVYYVVYVYCVLWCIFVYYLAFVYFGVLWCTTSQPGKIEVKWCTMLKHVGTIV